MKIRPNGPDHSVGDRECRGCEGQAWPKRHFDGFRIGNCDGLVHYELIPRSSDTPEVIHRCDSCGMPLNRWGFEEAAWEAAKREAKEVLAQRAKRREVITYQEFLSSVQAIRIEKRGLLLRSFLFEISWEESAAGRGMLTALIVTKTGSGPDAVLAHLAESLGIRIRDIDTFWIQELDRVFEAWSNKEPAPVPRAPTCEYTPSPSESKSSTCEDTPAGPEARTPACVSEQPPPKARFWWWPFGRPWESPETLPENPAITGQGRAHSRRSAVGVRLRPQGSPNLLETGRTRHLPKLFLPTVRGGPVP
jgi:hypothetical protein